MNLSAPTGLDRVLTTLTSTYSLDRRVDSTGGSSYGNDLDYNKDAVTAELYLYNPSASHEVVTVGEQHQGVLSGICKPTEDVQLYDRLTYGDTRYEIIDPIEPQPTVDETEFIELSLDRVAQPIPELIG